jgi:uncharacterized protein YceK
MKILFMLILFTLSGCGTLMDTVCMIHGMGDTFAPSVEKQGDAIQPKAP